MKDLWQIILYIIALLSIAWILLTLWVQLPGHNRTWHLGNGEDGPSALIVFDPDPIYNLDEQICLAFGQALAKQKFHVQVATVSAAMNMKDQPDVFVLCANTYNWSPDQSISNFIQKISLKKKKVVAITLGSGSTEASRQKFEKLIKEQGGDIIGSKSFWLMKPNDETSMTESNVKIAIEMSYQWGQEIGDVLAR